MKIVIYGSENPQVVILRQIESIEISAKMGGITEKTLFLNFLPHTWVMVAQKIFGGQFFQKFLRPKMACDRKFADFDH